jgi:hypothetical protein
VGDRGLARAARPWQAGKSFERPGERLVVCLIACLLVALAPGCGKRKGGAKHIPRDHDAQAVVVIEDPIATTVTIEEREPNDEVAQATSLAPGTGARATLNGDVDADFYRVETSAPGMLAVRLGGIEGVDLVLELLDAEGAELARSDRGPAQTVEGIANFPVEAGVYHLAVREFVSKRRQKQGSRTGPSPSYELAVEILAEPPAEQEREPNDDAAGAREILIGDDAAGYIGWAGDVDVWKLPIEGFTAQYSLDIDITGIPRVSLTLDVLDPDGRRVLRRKGEADSGLSVRNLVPVTDENATGPEPRFFYVRLEAKRSSPIDAYRIHVATRLLDLEQEIEPNDEAAHAMLLHDSPILEGVGKRVGFLTVGDVDQYRLLPADEPVLLTVEVVPRETVDVTVSVLVAGETRAMANAGAKGGKEYLAEVSIPAGQAAQVQVSGAGGLGDAARYDLTWSLTPGSSGRAPEEPMPVEEGQDILDDYED